jgi:c-di-GMP-binding flagellar brake protein YcgR
VFESDSPVRIAIKTERQSIVLDAAVVSWDAQIIELALSREEGQALSAEPGTPVEITESCHDSALIIHSQVAGMVMLPQPRLILQMPGWDQIERIQRRRTQRYNIEASCPWQKSLEPGRLFRNLLQTRNVSLGGALISSSEEMTQIHQILIDLASIVHPSEGEKGKGLWVRATILRAEQNGTSLYGVSFSHLDAKDRKELQTALERKAISRPFGTE